MMSINKQRKMKPKEDGTVKPKTLFTSKLLDDTSASFSPSILLSSTDTNFRKKKIEN